MSDATNVKVTRDEKAWEMVLSAEISAESLAKHRVKALKEIQKTAKLDGFRVGKAPEDAIIRVYGESPILRQAAEYAIQSVLPELFAAQNTPIVDTPRVTTDEPAAGKPLAFTARAALAPEIALADYKKISKKHRETEIDSTVTDKEHTDALTHLRRERHRIGKIESGTDPQKAAEESKAAEEKDLPQLDDEFVQSLGYPDAAAFSTAVRKNIGDEKQLRESEKKRAAILDELVKDSTIHYPAALREYELEDMEARLKDDLARIGQNLDTYLSQTKQTREKLRETWAEAADKRAKVRLILGKIAQEEKIEVPEKDLAHELGHAKEHYPDANEQSLRTHIAHVMRNELVLIFLTGEKPPEPHNHDHQ